MPKLSRWGNSLGVRIPTHVAQRAAMQEGDEIYIRLLDSGEVLMSCQISASLPFHISSAEFKLSTIQFPLPIQNHLLREEQGERYHAVHPAAFFSR